MFPDQFPETLLEFIRRCTPSLSAVEMLVFIAGKPEATWTLEELTKNFKPRGFNELVVAEHLKQFSQMGLVREEAGRFSYRADNPPFAAAVELLVTAFNERPVTLIRTIYALADDPLRSFSDAFRFKKE
jgi:hypothetical protein